MSKILVIDDESWLREMIRLALAQHGFEVVEAGDTAEGIAAARGEMPDLILCDVNMDKAGAGYALLSKLREDTATAASPFILMTGLADAADGAAADSSVNDFQSYHGAVPAALGIRSFFFEKRR